MIEYDTIIIGAGAAGLFAAFCAGKNQKKVLLIEHNKDPGKKILISGGGRCNFTNLNVSHHDYTCENSHFIKSALSKFTPQDFIQLVESYGIDFYEKKMGQLFCKNSSREILEMLKSECQKFKVDSIFSTSIENISKNTTSHYFELKTQRSGPVNYICPQLIIATGGLSLPSLGASDFGYKIAKQFGHKIIPTSPALVPFTLSQELQLASLSGISLPVQISTKIQTKKRSHQKNTQTIRDDLLFTHKGLSGPAALKISLYWQVAHDLIINFLPEKDVLDIITEAKNQKEKDLQSLLQKYLPKKFVQHWLQNIIELSSTDLHQLSKKDLEKIQLAIHQWAIIPTGTEGFRKAEVTRGGVCTSKISSKNMESKLVPGLHFIGEVMDVTGLLGGYNFQWSWSSAYLTQTM